MVVFIGAVVAVAAIGAVAATSIENGPKKKVNEMNKHLTMEHVVNTSITQSVSAHASSNVNASQTATITADNVGRLVSSGNCRIDFGNITQDMDIQTSVMALADQNVQNDISEKITNAMVNNSRNTTNQSEDGIVGSIFGSGESRNTANITQEQHTELNTDIKNIVETSIENIIDSSQEGIIVIRDQGGAECTGDGMTPSDRDNSLNSNKYNFYREGILGNIVKQMNEDDHHYYIPNCRELEDCDSSNNGNYEFKKGNITVEDLKRMYISFDKQTGGDANIKAFTVNQSMLIKSVSSSIAKQITKDKLGIETSSSDIDNSINTTKQETKTALRPWIFGGGSAVSCVAICVIGLVIYFVVQIIMPGGGKGDHIGGNIVNKIKMSNAMFIKLVIVLALVYISLYR